MDKQDAGPYWGNSGGNTDYKKLYEDICESLHCANEHTQKWETIAAQQKAEIERLTKEYDEEVTYHDIEEKDLKQEIERLDWELRSSITEKETYYANGLQAQVELRQEIKRLEGELRAARQEINRLNGEDRPAVTDLADEIVTLQAGMHGYIADIHSLKSELQASTTQVSILREALTHIVARGTWAYSEPRNLVVVCDDMVILAKDALSETSPKESTLPTIEEMSGLCDFGTESDIGTASKVRGELTCEMVVSISVDLQEEKECGKPASIRTDLHFPICDECYAAYPEDCK